MLSVDRTEELGDYTLFYCLKDDDTIVALAETKLLPKRANFDSPMVHDTLVTHVNIVGCKKVRSLKFNKEKVHFYGAEKDIRTDSIIAGSQEQWICTHKSLPYLIKSRKAFKLEPFVRNRHFL